ncbi:MAG: 1-acyl-sn-glycerol-3-phosphate acyltransferase, partial [Halioglobus sp.]|nr:1-acyl-sn-glycerol-3-phosphate acyltransferase [Halioglobus sp.]
EAAVRQLQQLEDGLRPGTSILFFPEGTRRRSGTMQAFKMGAFHMACDLEVPVLPITVIGSDKILTPDGMDLHPGSAELVIHPAVSREEVKALAPEALRDRAREIISGVL